MHCACGTNCPLGSFLSPSPALPDEKIHQFLPEDFSLTDCQLHIGVIAKAVSLGKVAALAE
jgi:hypothetical protein